MLEELWLQRGMSCFVNVSGRVTLLARGRQGIAHGRALQHPGTRAGSKEEKQLQNTRSEHNGLRYV